MGNDMPLLIDVPSKKELVQALCWQAHLSCCVGTFAENVCSAFSPILTLNIHKTNDSSICQLLECLFSSTSMMSLRAALERNLGEPHVQLLKLLAPNRSNPKNILSAPNL